MKIQSSATLGFCLLLLVLASLSCHAYGRSDDKKRRGRRLKDGAATMFPVESLQQNKEVKQEARGLTAICAVDVVQCRKDLKRLKNSCGGRDFPVIPVVGVVTIIGIIIAGTLTGIAGLFGGRDGDD